MIDQEVFEERAAIMEFDAGMTREVAEKTAMQHMHECEVRDVIKRFYPDGDAAKEYLDLCEKKRGKAAADSLRNAVRAEWMKLKVAA
jgi:hypothetical protein